ncbi:MAG: hypothetical protein AAFR47_10665 [Pseudomonadota bacterium]
MKGRSKGERIGLILFLAVSAGLALYFAVRDPAQVRWPWYVYVGFAAIFLHAMLQQIVRLWKDRK